jgi:hypothetical protein
MKATLLAKSSSGESYKVEFLAENSDVRIFCHCQAGVLHRMCKHKQALIDGNVEICFVPKGQLEISPAQRAGFASQNIIRPEGTAED